MPAAMSGFRRFGFAAATLLLCSGLTVTAATTASAATGARAAGGHAAGTSAPVAHRTAGSAATGGSAKPGPAASPDISTKAGAQAASTPSGYSPADLQSAYNLTSASASGGKGAIVAIIGAYDDPNAGNDLATYRSHYGLPPCTTANGCFTKVNQNGQASPLPPTAPEASTAETESMDMDMVSAICPNCHILLVEASSGVFTDMGPAVDSAVTLGARYVIVGWITGSPIPSAPVNQDFDHPGVVITAPAGDKGFEYYGATTSYVYPASLPYVTAVGGTTLSPAPGTSRGWSESVWGPPTNLNGDVGTGSGCAKFSGKPSWQSDTGCAGRTDNDVAAVASNVSFYDTAPGDNGWYDGTGTTLSAAIIGAVYALAGTPSADTYPVTYPYLNSADLYPVTSGGNSLNGSCQPAYLCSGGSGYNGPAGWGTPDGTAAFTPDDSDQVAILSPSMLETGATALPETVNLPIQALDSAGNTLTYGATGLPEGVSIDPSTGVISGTLTHDYNGTSTITATDSAGASASISLPWDVENYLALTSPGAQQTEPGAAVTLKIKSNDADPNATKTFSATGLPPGLTISSSTGVISGTTSSTIGSYDVTVSATDSDGTTTSTPFSWKVWNLITVTAPSFKQSYVGTPVSVTISATDSASGRTLSYSAINLPPGLSINSSTGVISGTPTPRAFGYWLTSVTVTDGTGSSGTAGFEWILGGVITLSGPSTQRSVAGQAIALSFGTHDSSPDDIVTYKANGLPPGLNLSATTPLITGWPTTAGTYHVIIGASGGYNGAASASFTWTVTAAADSGPTGPVHLNLGGKCLDDTGNSSANGTKIQIWTCNGGAAQNWTYAKDGTLRIHGKCLDVIGRSTAANAKLDLWACNGGTNQQWDIDTGAQLRGLASGYCLTDPASSTTNGTQLEITGCGGYSLREWTLPAGPTLSAIPGKCLDDTGDSTANGNKVEVWTCNGGAAQNWTSEPDGTIRVAGKCLDDTGNGTASGTKIQIWTCNGGAAQQWAVKGSNNSLGVQIEHGSLCATPTSMTAANGAQLVLGACGTDESYWHAV